MSIEREFPLPKVIGNGTGGLGALARPLGPLPEADVDPDFFSPVTRVSDRAGAIKDWLRLLTHREMRQFVQEIFDAHAKLFPPTETSILARSITAAQLSDVLDKVAYGD